MLSCVVKTAKRHAIINPILLIWIVLFPPIISSKNPREKAPIPAVIFNTIPNKNISSNVNPNVHHPRWSQASERYIGKNIGGGLGGLFAERHDTMMYNGYNEVSNLYKDMDLSVFF